MVVGGVGGMKTQTKRGWLFRPCQKMPDDCAFLAILGSSLHHWRGPRVQIPTGWRGPAGGGEPITSRLMNGREF